MRIAVPTETVSDEARVAATPETVKKFVALGAEVAVEKGAGLKSGIADADYEAAGARLAADAGEALHDADVVLKVRRPDAAELAKLKHGAVVVAIMDPYGQEAALGALAAAGVDAFAMELMPRITRAQSMDVLSSQANLAGYRAVIDAAAEYGRALPMMMTAAGTVPAAKAFIMGVGVAGLQAIATARRLGAIVTATDVRPATKEQVESLGAKFVAVEDDEFKQAETAGGYAKEMSKEYQAKQADLVAAHIAKQDIVITTALIPGRPAPRLITTAMVKSMRRGSVIVDLAVERGGNCEASKPGEVAIVDGVTILGHLNVAGRLAATASALYARNLFAFVETLIDKPGKKLAIKWDDEIVRATCLTRDGAVVHPLFAPKPAAKPEASSPPAATPETPAPAPAAVEAPVPIAAAVEAPIAAAAPIAVAVEAPVAAAAAPEAPVVPEVPVPAAVAPEAPVPAPAPEASIAAALVAEAPVPPAAAPETPPPAPASHEAAPPAAAEPVAAPSLELTHEPSSAKAASETPAGIEPAGAGPAPILIAPALSTAAYEASRLSAHQSPATPNADPTPPVEPAKAEAAEKAPPDGQRDNPANP